MTNEEEVLVEGTKKERCFACKSISIREIVKPTRKAANSL
jgi:hypothetical protein